MARFHVERSTVRRTYLLIETKFIMIHVYNIVSSITKSEVYCKEQFSLENKRTKIFITGQRVSWESNEEFSFVNNVSTFRATIYIKKLRYFPWEKLSDKIDQIFDRTTMNDRLSSRKSYKKGTYEYRVGKKISTLILLYTGNFPKVQSQISSGEFSRDVLRPLVQRVPMTSFCGKR